MNIIHFSDTYYPLLNGVTVAVDQFTKKAAEDGHQVILFTPSCSLRNTTEKIGNLTIIKIRSVPFPIYPGVQAALPNLARLFKIIKEFKPDIIHTHSPFVLGILGSLIARILNIKLVSTYHTLFSQGGVYLSPKRLIPGSEIKNNSEEGLLALIIWKLQIIFFNVCDAVIAPTKTIHDTLIKQGIKTKIVTIPSGLDMSKFPAKTKYLNTKKILHLGRLGYEKAIDQVVKAFAIALKTVPDAELIIAGDGPAKQNLQKLAKTLKITKSVTFLGKVIPEKTPEVYRSADIFVTASPFETQGLVLNEAMLSGLPVVAAAINAPIDLITPGKNGYLFPENDIDAFADAIVKVLNTPKQVEKFGKDARKVSEQFDSIAISRKLIEYYKTL